MLIVGNDSGQRTTIVQNKHYSSDLKSARR